MTMLPDLILPDDVSTLAARYAEDGVVPVRGLLRGDLLAALIAQVAAFRAGDGEGADARTSVKHLPGRSIVRGLAHRAGPMRDLAENDAVARFLAAIAGVPSVRYWNDLTLAYAPAAPAGESAWHHDIPAFPLRAQAMPTLWIALSDVDWDSSPLVFAPGSHKDGALYPPSTSGEADPLPGYSVMPDWEARIDSGEVERLWWPIQPGDAVVMHSHVVHCTPANRNEEHERVSILTRWLSGDAVWHRDAYSTPVPGIPERDWKPGAPAPTSFLT